MVQLQSMDWSTGVLKIDHRLKCFQRLKGALKTYRSGFDVVLQRGLRHDRADEVVGENVCPDFLVY